MRAIVEQTARALDFDYTLDVLPITVAALMTGKWLLRHIQVPRAASRVILPGYLVGELEMIRQNLHVQVECGPRDIRDLPSFFGEKRAPLDACGTSRIEIIAEINYASRMERTQLRAHALRLKNEGADIIDLGCEPGRDWNSVGDAVSDLRDAGLRVSIDSFDPREVEKACRAGAELVLSVNSQNRHHAVDWGAEVVVIPDTPTEEKNFSETVEFLVSKGVAIRIDPILEPIGCGFTASLQRYINCRTRFPNTPMMMGIGNITELTDADSAAINVLLLGICEELGIESVLTTEVINWAKSSVKECDLARRIVHYACKLRIPPKHLDENLVLLRDPKVNRFPTDVFAKLAASIRDSNIRIFAQDDEIHVVSSGMHLRAADPFELMRQLQDSACGPSIDSSHAFYLGFEMAKALTAITLGKQYEQDQALRWGFLTRPERHHRLSRQHQKSADSSD